LRGATSAGLKPAHACSGNMPRERSLSYRYHH
jgi:hypothetical protein